MDSSAPLDSSVVRASSVAKGILATLWEMGTGTIDVFLSVPYKGFGSRRRSTYRASLGRLRQRGLVRSTEGSSPRRPIYALTELGKKEAVFAYIDKEVSAQAIVTPKKWDGGWRIIFFDIPEKKRRHRDYLREVLRAIGFKEFQKSVWIYPHAVPAFLRDLLFEESIKQHTRFITTEHIEYDQDLRKLFPDIFFKESKPK